MGTGPKEYRLPTAKDMAPNISTTTLEFKNKRTPKVTAIVNRVNITTIT